MADIITNDSFWDCECDDDFIHPKSQPKCDKCGTKSEDQPDSRLDEVYEEFGIAPSFGAKVRVTGETEFVGNGLRFVTYDQAADYAAELTSRWFAVEEWIVVPNALAPNYKFENGRSVPLEV